MENQRLLIAAFLSVLVLVVWSYLFPAAPIPEPDPSSGVEDISQGLETPSDLNSAEDPESVGDSSGLNVENPSSEAASSDAGVSPEATTPTPLEPIEASSEERVVLENEWVRAEFSNEGAQLLSLRLKTETNSQGGQIEMIRARGRDPHPFALVQGGEKVHRLNKVLFETGEDAAVQDPNVTFTYRGEAGEAKKTFILGSDGLLQADIRVAERGGWGVILGPGVRNPDDLEQSGRFVERGVGYRRGEETELLKAGKKEEDIILSATGLRWLALEDNFFFAGMLPESGIREILVRPVLEETELDPAGIRFKAIGNDQDDRNDEQMLIVEASSEEMRFHSLFASKRYSMLKEQPYPFEETVRWGWFGFLSKPLYYGLEWIHSNHIANYGWAIVVVTILIRIIFFPLTWKSQKSMTKMQELNPKMQAIRNKYRGKLKDKQGRPNLDAQKQQNEEMMALYKKEGVNPASGCLPMLLQMPVFFAFYNVLAKAVELRQAEWIGWIYDLASPDPYFVLPVLMTVSSFLMQKIMPSSPDPMQRRLLQFMPIAFGAFALYFPSGLVLYWFTNNLLTLGQQLLLNKMRAREQAAAA